MRERFFLLVLADMAAPPMLTKAANPPFFRAPLLWRYDSRRGGSIFRLAIVPNQEPSNTSARLPQHIANSSFARVQFNAFEPSNQISLCIVFDRRCPKAASSRENTPPRAQLQEYNTTQPVH